MALYEYVCESGHRTEQHRPVEDRNVFTPCPECGKPMTRPMTTAWGFRMGKQGLLQAAGTKHDGVHHVGINKQRSTFGPGGKVQRDG